MIFTEMDQSTRDVDTDSVKENFTAVKNVFSENLLRPIVDLTPDQQLTLVTGLLNPAVAPP